LRLSACGGALTGSGCPAHRVVTDALSRTDSPILLPVEPTAEAADRQK
jgi:hypothetical protein